MKHSTDRRSIVATLVWGILTICLVGSPSGASGQPDQTVPEQDSQAFDLVWTAAGPVPAQDVEDLDVLTRLAWTIQMVVAPGTLANVSPLYAYDLERIKGKTVHPDRIRPVAAVKPCNQVEFNRAWESTPRDGQNDVFWCAYYTSEPIDAFLFADYLRSRTPSEAYFATTYPLPGIEPEKRFVVEQPE